NPVGGRQLHCDPADAVALGGAWAGIVIIAIWWRTALAPLLKGAELADRTRTGRRRRVGAGVDLAMCLGLIQHRLDRQRLKTAIRSRHVEGLPDTGAQQHNAARAIQRQYRPRRSCVRFGDDDPLLARSTRDAEPHPAV